MAKVALVTGASSVIGRMVAQKLKSAGFRVYAATRRMERMKDLERDVCQSLYRSTNRLRKHMLKWYGRL